MRTWTILLILIAAALSGCAGDDLTAPETDDTQDTGGSDGNETVADESPDAEGSDGSPEANNTAPVALLSADVTNGTAPLAINVTVDGSDADGDNLTWTLTAGNDTFDGDVLPSVLNFTLEEGNHTFVLTVSDGELEHSVDLTIPVAAAAAEEVDPDAPVDMGWYVYDPVTEMCHVKEYDDVEGLGVVYNAPLSGGDWYILESNEVEGLQIENNHPAAPAGNHDPVGGFALVDIPECKDGDQVAV